MANRLLVGRAGGQCLFGTYDLQVECLDNQCMQGRATQALHFCFIGSLIGGVFGVMLLIVLTPPLVELVLKTGPAELFRISVFGVTIIASIGGGPVIKGLRRTCGCRRPATSRYWVKSVSFSVGTWPPAYT